MHAHMCTNTCVHMHACTQVLLKFLLARFHPESIGQSMAIVVEDSLPCQSYSHLDETLDNGGYETYSLITQSGLHPSCEWRQEFYSLFLSKFHFREMHDFKTTMVDSAMWHPTFDIDNRISKVLPLDPRSERGGFHEVKNVFVELSQTSIITFNSWHKSTIPTQLKRLFSFSSFSCLASYLVTSLSLLQKKKKRKKKRGKERQENWCLHSIETSKYIESVQTVTEWNWTQWTFV